MNWTDEKETELRIHWDDKSLSTKQIGKIMDTTKNSIIGKANRLGLDPRPNVLPPGYRRPLTAKIRPVQAVKPQQRTRDRYEINKTSYGRLKSLLDLGPNECKWPISRNQNNQHMFCGGVREDGAPYCEPHKELCARNYK